MENNEYPADESDLTSEQFDSLAEGGENVRFRPPIFAFGFVGETANLGVASTSSQRMINLTGQLATFSERDDLAAAAG